MNILNLSEGGIMKKFQFKKLTQASYETEESVFNFINEETAEALKYFLLEANINELVNLKSRDNLLKVSFNNIKENKLDLYYPYDMYYRELTNGNLTTILDIKKVKQPASLFYGVGEWREEGSYRLNGYHIVLGSDNKSKLKEFFAQIDLSEAIEDENYIYILKNLTKNSGHASIKRLYTVTKKSSNEERKEKLLDLLKPEVFLSDSGDKFIVVSKIDKKEFWSGENDSELLKKFLEDFINYAFAVEEAKL